MEKKVVEFEVLPKNQMRCYQCKALVFGDDRIKAYENLKAHYLSSHGGSIEEVRGKRPIRSWSSA